MWHIKKVEMLRRDVEPVVTNRQIKGNITGRLHKCSLPFL